MNSSLRALALACLLVVPPALAQAPEAAQAPDSPRLHELEFSWARDGAIFGGAAVLWISTEALFKDQLAPETCRWCDVAPDGTSHLNALDRWGRDALKAQRPEGIQRAKLASDVLGYFLVPAGAVGASYLLGAASDAPAGYFAQDALIILESAALAAVVNQGVKFAVGRERPFVSALPESEKRLTKDPADNNLSFYSGHTAVSFALVTAAGTVAELRGYRHSTWVWAVGLPLAASVGALRMASDRHYLTDVLVGAVAGSAFGIGVPLLLHGRKDAQASEAASPSALRMRMSAGPGGFVLSGSF